jgi:hypothetical protein
MDLLGVPATPLLGCTWGLAVLAQSCGKRHEMALHRDHSNRQQDRAENLPRNMIFDTRSEWPC